MRTDCCGRTQHVGPVLTFRIVMCRITRPLPLKRGSAVGNLRTSTFISCHPTGSTPWTGVTPCSEEGLPVQSLRFSFAQRRHQCVVERIVPTSHKPSHSGVHLIIVLESERRLPKECSRPGNHTGNHLHTQKCILGTDEERPFRPEENADQVQVGRTVTRRSGAQYGRYGLRRASNGAGITR